MIEIIIEHVRSFSKRQRIPLRPLTLLVGENSSGKSTFLAVTAAVFDSGFPTTPAFNEPPYSLGTFDTIATYKGGQYGRDRTFSIGFASIGTKDESDREAIATYRSEFGEVALSSVRLDSEVGTLAVKIAKTGLSGTITGVNSKGRPSRKVGFERKFGESPLRSWFQVDDAIFNAVVERIGKRGFKSENANSLFTLAQTVIPPHNRCSSFAPIRSKPRRTYDELSEEYSPEGDHIPTLLARLLRQQRGSTEAVRLREALLRFGSASGLFKRVDVRRMGRKVSDPFQIRVSIAGPPVNLTDVGYGVSQALPIVVQSVLKSPNRIFLLQQPEVHLHPRAQAALGTFFAELASGGGRTFLIETHSDHLVDRVRQEVARGNISHKDVSILFFHKPRTETTISSITLDRHGNIENAPRAYREFFLQEELNLFNRAGA